ncbi:MAG TPA: MFS transporter [bacterium]|nr:MFS transporter [bacterium]
MDEQVAIAGVSPKQQPGFRYLMRNRNFALLWSGQLVSEIGNRFHWVAVSLWIYAQTQSAAAVSLAVSSMFVGSLLVSLWAGAFVDRFNRRSILIASDLIRACLVILIPVLFDLSLWLVYIDLAFISIATAFSRPAIFSMIPQIVERKALMSANSFFTAMETGTEILGPIAAGFLAEAHGYAPLLYADGFTYLFSALCVIGMRLEIHSPAAKFNAQALWKDVVNGLQYIRQDALQRGLFVLIFPTTLVGAGLNALQTPLAKGEIRVTDAQFGTFQSVWGLGFLVASLILGWYGSTFRKSSIILAGYFVGFTATAAMGVSRELLTLLVTAFVVGFSNTLYYVGLGTVLMEYTPSNLIGRVVSTRQVALASVRIASPLVFGGLAESIGIRLGILLMTAIGTVMTLIAVWRFPIVRRFDEGSGTKRSGIAGAILVDPVDPEFHPGPQRILNLACVVIAVLTWAGVAVIRGEAAFLLAVALALATAGSLLKRWGWLP